MFPEAIAEFQTFASLSIGGHKNIGLAVAYAASGRRKDAMQIVPETLIALGLGFLVQKDGAFARLEKALEKHEDGLVYLKVHPFLDPLRSDSRSKDLVRRIGLPTE